MRTLLNVTKKLCLDNPVRIIAVKELRCLSGLLPAANRAVAHHPGTHAVRPLQNAPFCPISALGSNFNPQNTQCIPVVKIFACLELEQD